MSQGWQGPPGYQQQPPGYYPPPGYGPGGYGPGGYGPGGMRPPQSGSGTAAIVIVVVVGVLLVVGVLASLAISGVHRYLESAKSAEAKNTLVAIKRAVVSAYDVEPHKLCGGAERVPHYVPKGTKYQAETTGGQGYDSGSKTEGWKCLKFSQSYPSYYQYEYRVGGYYKGPSRGGPNPGPDGFEISAEGDGGNGGATSLFTLTGKIDPTTHELKVDDEVFVAGEHD